MVAAGRRVDYSWGPGHGPVSGVVNATMAAAGATMVGACVHASPMWALGGGLLAAAGAATSAGVHDMPGKAICYRIGCWASAGLWSAWSLWHTNAQHLWATGPWSSSSLVALGVGGVVAGTFGVALARPEAKRTKEAAARVAAQQADEEERRRRAEMSNSPESRKIVAWENLLRRVTKADGLQVIGMEKWGTGYGFTLEVELPDDGTTWEDIKRHEASLAAAAKAGTGCGVEVLPGVHQGVCLVEVAEKDALTEDRLYADTHEHKTINNPLTIGRYRDNSPVEVPCRQEVVLVIGGTGSGKTTTLNDLMAEHLETVDDIPMVIDFNGGGLALPWLLAWRANRDKVPNPPIACVASTEEQALLMTEWLLDVAKDRKSAYAHVKFAANETLLPITPKLPQYTLFVDEVAEILGSSKRKSTILRKVQENIEEIQRIGRDSGVRLVLASLSATQSTLGAREVSALAGVRIAMRVFNQAELAYLFDDYKVNPQDASDRGMGHITVMQGKPRPAKFDYLSPKRITEVVVATADRRPGADERAINLPAREVVLQDPRNPAKDIVFTVSGETYRNWWNMPESRQLLEVLDRGAAAVAAIQAGESAGAVAVSQPANAAAANGGQPSASTTSRKDTNVSETPSMADAMRDMESAVKAMNDAAAQADADRGDPGATGDDDSEPEVLIDWSIAESWLMEGAPKVTPEGAPKCHPRQRMLELLVEAGADGAGPSKLSAALRAEGYKTSRQTVSDWLREDLAKGLVVQPDGDGKPYFRAPGGSQ